MWGATLSSPGRLVLSDLIQAETLQMLNVDWSQDTDCTNCCQEATVKQIHWLDACRATRRCLCYLAVFDLSMTVASDLMPQRSYRPVVLMPSLTNAAGQQGSRQLPRTHLQCVVTRPLTGSRPSRDSTQVKASTNLTNQIIFNSAAGSLPANVTCFKKFNTYFRKTGITTIVTADA